MNELQIHQRHLPYAACLDLRDTDSIDLVVIHCTELPDLATARIYGEKIHHAVSGTGNSGHYYIDRDGRVEQWVPPQRIAHHVREFNKHSIGIELVNLGRYPAWYHTDHQEMTEHYPQKQVDGLVGLLGLLHAAHANLQWVTGHDLLDTEWVPASNNPTERVYRKRDPGPLFPWDEVLNAVRLLPYL
jgi:N-acetylmuramoyl-L-alanine amidase